MTIEQILKYLGAVRRAVGQAILEAQPAPEPICAHGCGYGYCPVKECPNG